MMKAAGVSVLLLCVLAPVLLGCAEGSNPSARTQATDKIVGTWEVFGASESPTGDILEAEDEFTDWSGPVITFYDDRSFLTEGIWDSSSSGTWSSTGDTYYLSFSDGASERVIYQDGELYTDIYGMFFWLR